MLRVPEGSIIDQLWQNPTEYGRKLEAYYNDNYGFRDFFIRLKNQLDYSLFGVSDEVLISPDGYLFSKEFIQKYRAEINRASPQQYEKLFARIQALNSRLKNEDIQLVFVPIPLADTIYP